MSHPNPSLIILGSGLAGYSLVREIRKLKNEIPITVITRDDGAVYSKPMLSNAFAQGKNPQSLVQKTAMDFAKEQTITILTHHQALSINRDTQSVTVLDDKQNEKILSYSTLVLATGASPRLLDIQGISQSIPKTVNNLTEYRHWVEGLVAKQTILLIGAGLVGCEFANDLSIAGFNVKLVDPAPWPLGRLLPEKMGKALESAMKSIGIDFYCGRTITKLDPHESYLDNGQKISFDQVLSAIGLLPRIELATKAGLKTERGILVDDRLQTSDPSIYSLGDCSETRAGPLPYVLPLMAQARIIAARLSGSDVKLVMPAMPVVVKTPALPLAVCPPPPQSQGEWHVEGENHHLKAVFIDTNGQKLGFALSGHSVHERQILGKEMPNLLA